MLLEKMIQAREASKSNETAITKELLVIEETAGFGENLEQLIVEQLAPLLAKREKTVCCTVRNQYDVECNADFVSIALSGMQSGQKAIQTIKEFLSDSYDVVSF